MLDLWQNNQKVAAQPHPEEGRDLPATFGETFGAAWSEGQLFSDNLAHMNARGAAINGFVDEARKAGVNVDAELSNRVNISGEYTDEDRLDAANTAVAKLKAQNPVFPLSPLSDEDLEQRTVEASRAARTNYEQIAAREKTFTGKLGMLAGGLATTAADPINLVAAAVVPEAEVGILGSAALWGTFGLVSQGVNEGTNAAFRERVQPGYAASGAPTENILSAGIGGAVFGAGFKTLGALWTRMKTGAWPQSVRDAGNIVESEANIQQSNVLGGVEGEVAHRTALQKSIDDIVEGRPVQVDDIVAGSYLKDYEKRIAPVMDAISESHAARNQIEMERAAQSAKAQPELPFEQSAPKQAAEAAVGKISDQLQVLARDAGFFLPPDEAEPLARQISVMPQDQALQTLDQFMLRPTTLRDTLPSVSDLARQRREEMAVAPEPRLQTREQMRQTLESPQHEEAIRADIDRARMTGDVKIPAGVDEKGEPIYRSLDDAMNEVDGYKAAAEQIQACANPAPEPENG